MHPLHPRHSTEVVEHVAKAMGQPVSLSLFSNRLTDSRCHWYSRVRAAREDLLHLSLPEREQQLHLYFFNYNGCLEMQSNPLDH